LSSTSPASHPWHKLQCDVERRNRWRRSGRRRRPERRFHALGQPRTSDGGRRRRRRDSWGRRAHGAGGDAVAGAHSDVVGRHRAHPPRRGVSAHRTLHPPPQQCEYPHQLLIITCLLCLYFFVCLF
jgi:hypothetical protein